MNLELLAEPDVVSRFRAKVDVNGPLMPHMESPCHMWTAATFKKRGGYGAFGLGGNVEKAHRVAFALAHGREPGPVLRHRCDNPPCVRDDHLLEGTHADNVNDKTVRDRVPHGEGHHAAKLTEDQVRAIRAERAAHVPIAEVALKYSISEGAVSMICTRKLWARVA